MGTVRAWLAILIVFRHARQFGLPLAVNFKLVDSQIGFHVTFFILISGFYIQSSIDELKLSGGHWLKRFAQRRFFRIAPCYYLILALYIVLFYLLPSFEYFSPFPIRAWEYLADNSRRGFSFIFWANNLLLLYASNNFVADILSYMGWHIPSWKVTDYMIVTQAWSLTVEIVCYLLAPLLLTLSNRKLLLAFAIASALGYGMNHATFDQAIIVHQLPFFLFGALMYRGYSTLHISTSHRPALATLFQWITFVFVMAVSFVIFLPLYNGNETSAMLIALVLCGFCLPSIAELTSHWKFDRLLGELSYPIYLCHIFCFMLAYILGARGGWMLLVSFLLTFGCALVTVVYFERPIRRWAAKRFNQ